MPAQILQEVDNNFIGINSRLDPSNLQPGFAQSAYNVRLQRGTAQPRKGVKRLTDTSLNSLTMVGSGVYVNGAGQDNIALVFTDRLHLYNTETGILSAAYMFPSQTIGGVTYYRDIHQGEVCDVVQALDKLYIFRGQETEQRYGVDGTNTRAALDLVYPAASINQVIDVTATWINSYASSHPTYAVGDEITIFNVNDNQHAFVNNTYIVKSVNGSSFTFSLTSAVAQNQSTHVYGCVVKVKPPLIWDGTSVSVATQKSIINNVQTQTGYTTANGSIPPSDFGLYFQNRIVCKVDDQVICASDILTENFDFQINTFKINLGGNDSIVGFLPWIENQFLVFMSRSIYVAYIDPRFDITAPDQSQITVVTTQIGCLSRKSIASAGQFVFFLSGKGVHMLTPQLDLKLIGNTQPLSEPIDDFFDNVNFGAAKATVSSYYDNRFFMALPINGSTRPNAIIVYNTLNQNWECIDTYPSGMFIDDYAICQYSQKRRQMILTKFKGLTNCTLVNGSTTVVLPNTVETIYVGMTVVASSDYPNAIPIGTTIQSIAQNGLSFTISKASTQSGTIPLLLAFGGIFLTEEYDGGDQFTSIGGTPVLPFVIPTTITESNPRLEPIDARIRSRQYTFDNTNEKRFLKGEYQFNNSPGDFIKILARTHDPDVAEFVMTYQFTGSNTLDSTLRPRIALRGACMDMEVQFITGRPALKSAILYSILANRSMISEE
jgi:hypothetical protein